MKILVTGASGYVGKHVAKTLSSEGHQVCLAQRRPSRSPLGDVVSTGSINNKTDWSAAVAGCDAVIHVAGRAPFQKQDASYEEVNVGGTRSLVAECSRSSVRTFVFISTLAVHGAHISPKIIDDKSPLNPVGDYARSKHQAEEIVHQFTNSKQTAVVLRLPLIYGAGAGGNWRALEKLITSRLPLPVAALRNMRSMIYIENLASAINRVVACATPNQAGRYIVSDPAPVSLRNIVEHVRRGMGRGARILPVPAFLMTSPLRMLGKGSTAESLFGDLILDGGCFNSTFNWTAPFAPQSALEKIGRELATAPGTRSIEGDKGNSGNSGSMSPSD